MIVLDASVLIGFLDAQDRHHATAEALLAHEVADDFGVSPITLAEVLVAPVRARRLEAVSKALDALQVETIALTGDSPLRLARLRVTSGMNLPDCCVLLAAERVQGRIATFDDRLAQAAEAMGLTAVGL